MDTMSAFAMSLTAKGKEQMVFDWDKAAQLIRERKPQSASAGLAGDWEYTGGIIYEDGKPVPKESTYVYLSSNWATPELEIDGVTIPCFKMQNVAPDLDAHTYWPESAITILNQKE